MIIDEALLNNLLKKAKSSERLRMNFDLRNSDSDTSQRMLNALQPGTVVPIHRHVSSSETVILLKGDVEEVFYDDHRQVTEQIHLSPTNMGINIPKGQWHTLIVHTPSVILEIKDGTYSPITDSDILK